jgi:hypothetical protein
VPDGYFERFDASSCVDASRRRCAVVRHGLIYRSRTNFDGAESVTPIVVRPPFEGRRA